MDLRYWEQVLADEEKRLGLDDGYKFVFGPWDTLNHAEIAFLSLNPGKCPDDFVKRTISDERGNSYEVEQDTTISPITNQFLRLARLLGVAPRGVLAGVVAPFRSGQWNDFSKRQKDESLALGRRFWMGPLKRPDLRLILVCSEEAAKLVVDVTGASFDIETPAGWGNVKLRRYRCGGGKVVVHLPHLSRFRLLGRTQSEAALREIL
ncbi:MAG: hypothetical protein OXC05_08430 [Halieaceae bacterium]|nr:hypothetical protein [Halieaceae bacterium]